MTQNYHDLLERVLAGFREIKQKSAAELKQWLVDQPFLLPPAVPVGDGMTLITPEGMTALREVGRLWYVNQPALSASLSREAAENIAVSTFGEIIGSSKDLPPDADLKSEFLKLLSGNVRSHFQTKHFHFPMRVFDQVDVGTFRVGPVVFYKRTDWLDAVEKISRKPFAEKALLLDIWAGRATEKVIPNVASDVFKAIGSCDWVASVMIEGRDKSRSEDCASTAVLVAMDVLGLPLAAKMARNLRGPGHILEARISRGLSQTDGSGLSISSSIDLPRFGGPPGSQVDFLLDCKELLQTAGKALASFVSVSSTGHTHDLMCRWVEGMFWFGQSRREQSEFIALVKLGIALDVLTDGGMANGILALSCAILGKSENDVITTDNRMLGAFVKKLYNEGRSQIAHGKLALLRELPLELHLADSFTSQILTGYIQCLEKYQGTGEYEDFLVAIPKIR